MASESVARGLAPRLWALASSGLATVAALAGCCAMPAQASEPLAARVGGNGIPLQRLEHQFEQVLHERRIHIARLSRPEQARGLRREALEQLVRLELFWLEAQARGLVAGDDEVERAVSEIRRRFRSDELFERHLQRDGFAPAGHRDHVRKQLSAERFAQWHVERNVIVGDADLEVFYAANPRLFQRPPQLHLRHLRITFSRGPAEAEREAARLRTLALRERILAGESFEELARRHSDDSTRAWGGAMDPVSVDELPPVFRHALATAGVGALSEVFESTEGWHLLRVEQQLPARQVPLADALARIRAWLHEQRGREALDAELRRLQERHGVELLVPL